MVLDGPLVLAQVGVSDVTAGVKATASPSANFGASRVGSGVGDVAKPQAAYEINDNTSANNAASLVIIALITPLLPTTVGRISGQLVWRPC